MYRIIPCVKDTYITDKIIKSSRSLDSNVGQAGTLDLFKLYNETYLQGFEDVYEKSRILMHFDLDVIREMTGSLVNFADPSFKCYLSLTNIYSGLPVPSNFSVAVNPLAKEFDEGRGFDVIKFSDKDTANWLTSSYSSGVSTLWSLSGSNASGSLGDSGVDFYTMGVISGVSTSLERTMTFSRGDENLLIDITTFVSGTLAGIIPDYGLRLALTQSQDLNEHTYFVKRFHSRHALNPFVRPKIIMKYNDYFLDNQLDCYGNTTNKIGIYNSLFGTEANFFSQSQEITGSNCLLLELYASRPLTVWSSSFSATHSQSINHLTSQKIYFSASFTGSQVMIGDKYQTGSYYANVFFDVNTSEWREFTQSTNWNGTGKIENVEFSTVWKSLDGTLMFSSGANVTIKNPVAKPTNVFERNYLINVTNLKEIYASSEKARLRVFIQDYNMEMKYYKIPSDLISSVFKKMYWRLIDFHTKEIVIPFGISDDSTRLSSDGNGMYFDMFMEDLSKEKLYEFEFAINENGKDYYIQNQGFKFKVTE